MLVRQIITSFSGSYFGLHMQDPVEQWDTVHGAVYIEGRQFRLLKSFHPEDYVRLQQVSPGTVFVFRPWIDDFSQGDWIEQAGLGAAEADAAADDYISRFADSVNQHMHDGLVESLNEEYPTDNPEKLAKAIAFDLAFIRRLKVHCPHVKPVVFCAAVGNPDHDEYAALIPLAQACQAAGGAFGYHGYWTVYAAPGAAPISFVSDADVARDLHLRWNVIDAYLVQRGIHVKWMIGESGATKGNAQGYQPDVLAGWKSPECWNGDEDAYIGDIAALDKLLQSTLTARQGRLVGVVLFTSRPGDGGTWQWFNVTGSMMWKLADHVVNTADGGQETGDGGENGENGGDEMPLETTERENLWEISVSEQIAVGISLNPGAKLQGAILGDNFTPVLKEKRYLSSDGRLWAYQPAERVAGDLPRRVYACEVVANGGGVSYGDVFWFDGSGNSGSGGNGGAVWAPIGTEEERMAAAAAGGQAWPGAWTDANPYGNGYMLRGQFTYHSGADLNLNEPTWDSDRGKGVFAIADGDVVYAGRFNENWGNLVVIRHDRRPGTEDGGFYSRYAHLGELHVQTGDVVFLGEQIGTVGGADVGLPYHLHFDISLTDKLQTKPGDWPGSDWYRLVTDYTDPLIFLGG